MGFDISYHPIDVGLIHNRLIPYVRGQGSIDDLVREGVRLAKVRFRANAWSAGVLERRRAGQHGQGPGVPDAFESNLHVWGRPFFITSEAPADVSLAIDRYLSATPDDVDAIALDMLRQLSPDLVGQVTPNMEGFLPSDADLGEGLRSNLDLFRKAYAAIQRGEEVTAPDGSEHCPRSLFASDFALTVIEFAANFRPGWMARGFVWPSYLLGEAKLDDGCLGPTARLFEPLLAEIPEIAVNLEGGIASNHTVGSYAPPESVPALRAFLDRHRVQLLMANEGCVLELRKIYEAVCDAERRGMGFAEAAEVYSGVQGIMN
jgi:hypothetical protein